MHSGRLHGEENMSQAETFVRTDVVAPDNVESELGTNDPGDTPHLELKGGSGEFLHHILTRDTSQIAAVDTGTETGVLFGRGCEIGPVENSLSQFGRELLRRP